MMNRRNDVFCRQDVLKSLRLTDNVDRYLNGNLCDCELPIGPLHYFADLP